MIIFRSFVRDECSLMESRSSSARALSNSMVCVKEGDCGLVSLVLSKGDGERRASPVVKSVPRMVGVEKLARVPCGRIGSLVGFSGRGSGGGSGCCDRGEMKGGERRVVEIVGSPLRCCSVLLADMGVVWLVGLAEGVGAEAESLREPVRDDIVEVLSLMTRLSWGGGGLPLTELLIFSICLPMCSSS